MRRKQLLMRRVAERRAKHGAPWGFRTVSIVPGERLIFHERDCTQVITAPGNHWVPQPAMAFIEVDR